jgi:hypothetical protein
MIILFVLAPAVLTILFWPAKELMYYLRYQEPPNLFLLGGMTIFFIGVFISARYGVYGIGAERKHSFGEWIRYTPVSGMQWAAAMLSGAAVHTLVFALLSTPVLLISALIAGIPINAVIMGGAVMFLACLSYRCIGIFLQVFFDSRRLVINILMWGVLSILLLFTIRFLPGINPILYLIKVSDIHLFTFTSIHSPDAADLHRFLPGFFHIGICGLFALLSFTTAYLRQRHIMQNLKTGSG